MENHQDAYPMAALLWLLIPTSWRVQVRQVSTSWKQSHVINGWIYHRQSNAVIHRVFLCVPVCFRAQPLPPLKMLLTLSLASNYSQRDCEKGHQLSTLATKCQLCVCVVSWMPADKLSASNSPPLQPSLQWLQLICCNPTWLMRELVLPSKAQHYGKEEVLLLDGEPGIKGYSCTAHVWLVMCLCLYVCVCSVRMVMMDEVPEILCFCYHSHQGHRQGKLINGCVGKCWKTCGDKRLSVRWRIGGLGFH